MASTASDAVVVNLARLLEERDRYDHPELTRDLAQAPDRLVLLDTARFAEPFAALLAAEVGPLEELRRKDDLRPLSRRIAHVAHDTLRCGKLRGPPSGPAWTAPTAWDARAHGWSRCSDGSDGPRASGSLGCCCVMQ